MASRRERGFASRDRNVNLLPGNDSERFPTFSYNISWATRSMPAMPDVTVVG